MHRQRRQPRCPSNPGNQLEIVSQVTIPFEGDSKWKADGEVVRDSRCLACSMSDQRKHKTDMPAYSHLASAAGIPDRTPMITTNTLESTTSILKFIESSFQTPR